MNERSNAGDSNSSRDVSRESGDDSGSAPREVGSDPKMSSFECAGRVIDALWVASSGTDPAPSVALLEAAGFRVRETASMHELISTGVHPEVVFVELTEDDRWLRAWRAARAVSPEALGVLVAPAVDADVLRLTLRERLVDAIAAGDAADLGVVVSRLRKRVREVREQTRRLGRLRRRCSKLEASRRELLRQISGLADGVATTYRDVAKEMKLTSMSAEFETIIRQDLDIETLLRTTLEFSLRKLGSTNGAIFLPNSCGDYTLGAYVNFDLPRDTAETLISQLADTMAPACERCREVVIASKVSDLHFSNIDADHWIGDQSVAIQACWQDNECIAVVVFFRDARSPFAEELRPTISLIASQFGRQLARVVKTHHRHKPKEQFGGGGGLMAA
jgi:hypothetical protein